MKGGKEIVDPKCKVQVSGLDCGGCHGRWFHEEGDHNSNSGSMIPAELSRDPYSLPGLYKATLALLSTVLAPSKRG